MSDSDWKFSQVFGERSAVEEVSEVDIVSAIEFDDTGNFLAVGDRGGRVIVFERSQIARREYKFYVEYQSHDPEFDYLKSLEIEEKINKIRWCKSNNSHFMLTTNDKTIKLWKLHNKKVRTVTTLKPEGSQLSIPKVTTKDSVVTATSRRVYSNAHTYHVNSISPNSDGETFISADDLRINLWNLEVSDQSFNIVDMKPENMEELSEVITAAEFHPLHCNVFMYSTSKGSIKLGDLRSSALCDKHSKSFEQEEDPSTKSFFSEIISSISDCKFSGDGRYMVSRDYMTVKVWDLAMESRPVKVIKIHEQLRSKLCDLYENDCIFDKFECNISHDGSKVITGSYNNFVYVYDWQNDHTTAIEANKTNPTKIRSSNAPTAGEKRRAPDFSADSIDYQKKCLHVAYHPTNDILSIGASSNLFIYDKPSSNSNSNSSDSTTNN